MELKKDLREMLAAQSYGDTKLAGFSPSIEFGGGNADYDWKKNKIIVDAIFFSKSAKTVINSELCKSTVLTFRTMVLVWRGVPLFPGQAPKIYQTNAFVKHTFGHIGFQQPGRPKNLNEEIANIIRFEAHLRDQPLREFIEKDSEGRGLKCSVELTGTEVSVTEVKW